MRIPDAGRHRNVSALDVQKHDSGLGKFVAGTVDDNMKEYGAAAYFPFLSKRQGIVPVAMR